MATRSSRTLALTKPSRFGLEIVRVIFGRVRRSPTQDVALSGELVRFSGFGDAALPQVFVAYENGQIILRPVSRDNSQREQA